MEISVLRYTFAVLYENKELNVGVEKQSLCRVLASILVPILGILSYVYYFPQEGFIQQVSNFLTFRDSTLETKKK